MIIGIIYLALSYWAVNRTIYANKIAIGPLGAVFLQKITLGAILGVILIPVAIIKVLLRK